MTNEKHTVEGPDREWLVGFFAAIISGPELIAPSVWIPTIMEEITVPDAEAASAILSQLMAVYNEVRNKLGAAPSSVCPDLSDDEAVATFSAGYLDGAAMHDAWLLPDEPALAPLSIFSALAGDIEPHEVLFAEGDANEWLAAQRAELAQTVTQLYVYWAKKRSLS